MSNIYHRKGCLHGVQMSVCYLQFKVRDTWNQGVAKATLGGISKTV